ncbi:MAG: hypothetical protein AAGG80_00820 [Pseudomonadota bacterium]
MKYLRKLMVLIGFLLFASISWADDMGFCVTNETGKCISLLCQDTNDPNCISNCRSQAQEQCKSNLTQKTSYTIQTQQSADSNSLCIQDNYQRCLNLICEQSGEASCQNNCKEIAAKSCRIFAN